MRTPGPTTTSNTPCCRHFCQVRGLASKKSTVTDEEELPESLLETIPDIDGGPKTIGETLGVFVPLRVEAVPEREEPIRIAPPPRATSGPTPVGVDLHAVLADIRRQMESTVSNEIARAEETFNGAMHAMEERIRELSSENERLRDQNATLVGVRARLDEHIRALHDLTASLR